MNSINQQDCDYVSVEDLAAAAGVSERTLRSVSGILPNGAGALPKALQNADASVTTVTQVATQFGVWELGRFAQDYRALFDELPSETLRRAQ
jgi:AraC family transcriptional regulator, ethanolamine operon transcriptional activator